DISKGLRPPVSIPVDRRTRQPSDRLAGHLQDYAVHEIERWQWRSASLDVSVFRGADHQARPPELAEPCPRRRAQPAVPDPVHQLDLQHEMRALLLLAAAQSEERPDVRGDRRA